MIFAPLLSITMILSDYDSLLDRFRSCDVDIGTSLNPPSGSIGEWLISNVTKTRIAAQVGAILIAEGYAERVGTSKIQILSSRMPDRTG